ncbi:MAG TPA: acetyl-CoA carboxylase biotin carboxyl carrier protein [Dongiaceae bacterium]|jgi:acetyl-CoA carboxylase biotin carboxyl carrier protein|nr:acetyl-CoA carboxylase biotin carboxyl carrier protein [Dongiaceae bacterium]
MRIDEVRRLIRLVEESEISELEVWKWWGRIRIRKGGMQNGNAEVIVQRSGFMPAVTPHLETPAPSSATPEPPTPSASDQGLIAIKSPMVGTFYRAPAPDAEPYIQIGDSVEPGQTVCIIEAMKLMNEIQSEVRGKIVRALVENATPVEFGQDLFLVKPD